jgi:hypothetical protein
MEPLMTALPCGFGLADPGSKVFFRTPFCSSRG